MNFIEHFCTILNCPVKSFEKVTSKSRENLAVEPLGTKDRNRKNKEEEKKRIKKGKVLFLNNFPKSLSEISFPLCNS